MSVQAQACLRLLVRRNDLRATQAVPDPDAPGRALAEGQARLAIEAFALTANNITYAAFGDAMKYWQFFPTADAALGCVPVWGFATVVESRAAGVAVGERCYGFWPMGSHLVVTPVGIKAHGFVDGAAHRDGLPAAYNRVQFCRADPGYVAAHEARQALLRPLFITSFLIDDFLSAQTFFGARQVLLSSASSKTAYGTALCLAARDGLAVTGLTSAGNLGFTRSLGVYGRVLGYDEVAQLDAAMPTVFVDFSGSAAQRRAIHEHFADALAYSCSVGGTHWSDLGSGRGLPGPKPTLFFAPAQAQKRMGPPPEGWGRAGFDERLAASWARLMQAMDARPQAPWQTVQSGRGIDEVRRVYLELIEGRTDPRIGHMLSLAPAQA